MDKTIPVRFVVDAGLNVRLPGHCLARQQQQDGLLDTGHLPRDIRLLQVLDDVILRFVQLFGDGAVFVILNT